MKKIFSTAIIVFMLMLACPLIMENTADAAKYKSTMSQKVGKKRYYASILGQRNVGKQKLRIVLYNLNVTYKKKKKVIVKKIAKNTTGVFVTNKEYIYYSQVRGAKNAFYRYNIKTGKRDKIFKEAKAAICGYGNGIIYYGVYNKDYDTGTGLNAFCYNVKTRAKTNIVNNVDDIIYQSGHVFALGAKNEPSNTNIYVYGKLGKNGKVLGKALSIKIKKKKILAMEY
ncbi:MAG: hypothetical protein K6G63_06505, partial [Eubacterium sp.]|nr:hypothetical protein [Eubacterium sp.]